MTLDEEVREMGKEISALQANMDNVDDTLNRHEDYLNKIFSKLDKLTWKVAIIVGIGVGLSYVLPHFFPKDPPPKIEVVLPPQTQYGGH